MFDISQVVWPGAPQLVQYAEGLSPLDDDDDEDDSDDAQPLDLLADLLAQRPDDPGGPDPGLVIGLAATGGFESLALDLSIAGGGVTLWVPLSFPASLSEIRGFIDRAAHAMQRLLRPPSRADLVSDVDELESLLRDREDLADAWQSVVGSDLQYDLSRELAAEELPALPEVLRFQAYLWHPYASMVTARFPLAAGAFIAFAAELRRLMQELIDNDVARHMSHVWTDGYDVTELFPWVCNELQAEVMLAEWLSASAPQPSPRSRLHGWAYQRAVQLVRECPGGVLEALDLNEAAVRDQLREAAWDELTRSSASTPDGPSPIDDAPSLQQQQGQGQADAPKSPLLSAAPTVSPTASPAVPAGDADRPSTPRASSQPTARPTRPSDGAHGQWAAASARELHAELADPARPWNDPHGRLWSGIESAATQRTIEQYGAMPDRGPFLAREHTRRTAWIPWAAVAIILAFLSYISHGTFSNVTFVLFLSAVAGALLVRPMTRPLDDPARELATWQARFDEVRATLRQQVAAVDTAWRGGCGIPRPAGADPRHAPPGRFEQLTPAEAERVAAQWMRYLGSSDARATASTRDGGIDVDSSAWVAQVKWQAKPVSPAPVQQLAGAALHVRKRPIFFARSGYSTAARAYADAQHIPLLTMTGTVPGLRGDNDAGRRVLREGLT